MNNCIFAGRCGQDAELRTTPEGKAVAQFSIAVDTGKTKQGEKRPPLWVRASIWERRAESLAPHIKKGNVVIVSGPVRLEEWKDKDGEHRSQIAVTVLQFTFGGSPNKTGDAPESSTGPITDEDIPF
jgi:single-strand DNA-binding protein